MAHTYALTAGRAAISDSLSSGATYTPAFTGAVARTVASKLAEVFSPFDFGAIGDGASHPLSDRFPSLGAAQAVYPHATALTNQIDWAASQMAVNKAALAAGSIGAVVKIPAYAKLLHDFPLTLPRTGNARNSIVHVIGESSQTSKIIGHTTFPASRGLIEWAAVTDTVWGGRIAHLCLHCPDNVTQVRSIYHKSNKAGGLAAGGTTINDVMAEWFQCDLIDLRLEGNNQVNEVLIDLEVGNRYAKLDQLTGDSWRGLVSAPFTTTNYDTMLLRVADSYGGADPSPGEDSVGLGFCEVSNLHPMVLFGGWCRTFKGRAYGRKGFRTAFNNGPMPGRSGAYGYEFRNCWAFDPEDLNSEGGAGESQFYFYKCVDCNPKGFTAPVGTVPLGVLGAGVTAWAPATTYPAGYVVVPTLLVTTTAPAPVNRTYVSSGGVSGGTQPNWANASTAGATIADGTITWTASAGPAVADGVKVELCEGMEFDGNYQHPNAPVPSWRKSRNIVIDAASRNIRFKNWTLRGIVSGGAATANVDALSEISLAGSANSVSGDLVQGSGSYRLPYKVGLDPQQQPAVNNYRGDENLLVGPADLTNAAWGKTNVTITADAVADPISGTNRADKIVESAANVQHAVIQNWTRSGTKQQTFSVYLKAAGRTAATIYLADGTGFLKADCNLTSGAITASVLVAETGLTLDGSGSASVGNGWWRFWITGTLPAATAFTACYVFPNTNAAYLGDGASGVYAFGAQLETAATVSVWREANPTLFVGIDAPVQVMDGPMLSARTVSLSTAGAYNGAFFRIVQKNGGAFTRTVGGLKAIPASTDATLEVSYDGSAWKVSNYAADTDAVIAGKAATVHTHTLSQITDAGTAAGKTAGNAVGNVPMVESGGKLNSGIIPAAAGASKTWVVADQTAMLALSSAAIGDYAIQTGSTPANQQYYLNALPASTLANWVGPISGNPVTSVNTKTGAVTLGTGDIGETGGVLYYTTPRVQADAPNVTLGTAAANVFTVAAQVLEYKNATAHQLLIGPVGGSPAAPTIRGLDATDLPPHTHAESDVTGLVVDLANKAPLVHTHDDRYYTETETDALLAGKANATGANSFTGQQTFTVSAVGSRATFQALLGGGYVGAVIAVKDQAGAVTATIGADGGITAVSFGGDGSALTGLAAGNLASGTVPLARLSASSAVAAGTMSAADFAKLARLETVVAAGTITTNYTPDAGAAAIFDITLGAATVTINAPTNPVNGRKVEYRLKQDGVGNRAVAWNAVFAFGSDITGTTLSTAAGKIDKVLTEYDSTAAKWHITGFVRGYA